MTPVVQGPSMTMNHNWFWSLEFVYGRYSRMLFSHLSIWLQPGVIQIIWPFLPHCLQYNLLNLKLIQNEESYILRQPWFIIKGGTRTEVQYIFAFAVLGRTKKESMWISMAYPARTAFLIFRMIDFRLYYLDWCYCVKACIHEELCDDIRSHVVLNRYGHQHDHDLVLCISCKGKELIGINMK